MCSSNVKRPKPERKNKKHRLQGVKVLPLEGWMECLEEDILYGGMDPNKYPEIPPIVGRVGYYLHQRLCWFEYGGKAYARPGWATHFKYELDLYDAERCNARQYATLCALARDFPSVMTPKQRALMYSIRDVIQIKSTLLQSQKYMIALEKKLPKETNDT